jgi:hypothetical protein
MPRLLWAVCALMTVILVDISSHYSHAGVAPILSEPAFAMIEATCSVSDVLTEQMPHID